MDRQWRKQHANGTKMHAKGGSSTRDQVVSGELVVRQMTDSERARWDEHSAAADRKATPEQRARRDAARKRRSHQERNA